MLFDSLFRRKKSQRVGNPGWLKLAVFMLIGYAIFQNFQERQLLKQSTDPVLTVRSPSPPITPYERADLGTLHLPMNMHIEGDIQGQGEPAQCGQDAKVEYRVTYPANAAANNPREATEIIRIGSTRPKMPWVTALTGMKQGGVRQIRYAAKDYYTSELMEEMQLKPSDIIVVKAELHDLTPTSATTYIPFQATQRQKGEGAYISCGQQADIHVTLWRQDGTVLYDTRAAGNGDPLLFNIGESLYAYGLDRGAINMKQGEKRTLIVPPAYSIPTEANDNPLKNIIKPNQTLIADLEVINIR